MAAWSAAAVRAHGSGLRTIVEADLAWAVDAILWAAEHPRIDSLSYHESTFSMGADRAAAAALPCMLLAPFDSHNLDRSSIERALVALGTSLFDEVRAIFVKGCEPLWVQPCEIDQMTGTCRPHALAWVAATAGLRYCQLGSWNEQSQQRGPGLLSPPFEETLPAVADDALLLNCYSVTSEACGNTARRKS